jgi:rhodanese-related sulfurtransferase
LITENPVLRTPPGPTPQAVDFFAAKLAFETDASDVHAAFAQAAQAAQAGNGAGSGPGFVLVDSRGPAAWSQGHIPEAIHLPTDEIPSRAPVELDPAVPVVTYCWGPGCNGGSRAALALARLGFAVKEMIGGIEYWTREGYPVQTANGVITHPTDPLTAPVATISCEC